MCIYWFGSTCSFVDWCVSIESTIHICLGKGVTSAITPCLYYINENMLHGHLHIYMINSKKQFAHSTYYIAIIWQVYLNGILYDNTSYKFPFRKRTNCNIRFEINIIMSFDDSSWLPSTQLPFAEILCRLYVIGHPVSANHWLSALCRKAVLLQKSIHQNRSLIAWSFLDFIFVCKCEWWLI